MKYAEGFESGEVCYWDIFPEHKTVKIFKELFKADRSKDKNKSSKAMWYLALVVDIDSELYSMSKEEQLEIGCDMVGLEVDKYLGNKTKLYEYEEFYGFLIDTPLSADVRSLELKMLERQKFIKDTPYTVDHMVVPEKVLEDKDGGEYISYGKPYMQKGTAAQLDKMVTDTKKLHDEIRTLRDSLKSAQTESGKGGREDSFMEG